MNSSGPLKLRVTWR